MNVVTCMQIWVHVFLETSKSADNIAAFTGLGNQSELFYNYTIDLLNVIIPL